MDAQVSSPGGESPPSAQTPAAPRSRIQALYRPEALRGKVYARIPQAPAHTNIRLTPSIVLALSSLLVLTGALMLLPVNTSFRAQGWLAIGEDSVVVRSSRSGQIMSVAAVGQPTVEGAPIAVLSHVSKSAAGAGLGGLARSELDVMNEYQLEELKLIDSRHALASRQLDERERALRRQAETLDAAMANQRVLVEEATRISQRVSAANQNGIISRLDSVALVERATQANIKLIELQRDQDNAKSELTTIERSREIARIDRLREVRATKRLNSDREMALLRDAAEDRSTIPAPRSGTVLLSTKRTGDWVEAGEQVAVVGRSGANEQRVEVHVPPELANLILKDQLVRIWANPQLKTEAPLLGRVDALIQKSATPDKSNTQSFVAQIVLRPGESVARQGLASVLAASQVDVEIVLVQQRLIEALLPRRVFNGSKKNS